MAKHENSSRPKLSADQVFMVCREFIPVGDLAYHYAEQLRVSGFDAFQPYEDFFRSFAKTPDEFDLHRQIRIERAKILLGNPWPPLNWLPEYRRPLFKSPLLEELRAKRDVENGVPETELAKRYPGGESLWRSEIDPCGRHSAYLEVTHREVYDARWAAAVEAMKLQVQKETRRFATNLSGTHTFDKDGRYALFTAVMERDAEPLGFHYDKRKSRSNFPVFSKAVAGDWDLCWAIEEPNFFYPFEGHFEPYLEIRHRELRGSIRKGTAGEYLHIRYYTSVVPGFFNAYRTFRASDELETMIKAHLCLYGLMAPIIEGGMQKILGESTERSLS